MKKNKTYFLPIAPPPLSPNNHNLSRKKIVPNFVPNKKFKFKIFFHNISELRIYNNDIGNNGVKLLAEAIKVTTCGLKSLDLSCNNITEQGMHVFSHH